MMNSEAFTDRKKKGDEWRGRERKIIKLEEREQKRKGRQRKIRAYENEKQKERGGGGYKRQRS